MIPVQIAGWPTNFGSIMNNAEITKIIEDINTFFPNSDARNFVRQLVHRAYLIGKLEVFSDKNKQNDPRQLNG